MARLSAERTPIQQRSDVDSGRHGDKTPGFDPAAAPMETDAEAAGTRLEGETNAPPRDNPRFQNGASYGNAMRSIEDEPGAKEEGGWPSLAVAATIIISIAVVIGLVATLL